VLEYILHKDFSIMAKKIVCSGYGGYHGESKGRKWFACSACRWSASVPNNAGRSIDPCGDGYKNLTAFLDTLIKLVEAKIKWISSLAQNRILRSKV
jgi:hypothetical protein